jgi:uncharacterized protein
MSDPRRVARRRPSLRAALTAGLIVALAVLAPATGRAQSPADSLDGPPIPAPVGYVNDLTGTLDEPTRAKLEGFLDQVEKKTGAQFALLIVRTTAPVAPTDYKVRVFERWGIGRKGSDEGLLMLVALEEREVRFETGYGLEGALPDARQSRIFRDEMAPRFRAGDMAGGIIAGTTTTAAYIAAEKGVTLEWDGRELRYGERRDRGRVPVWVPLLVFIIVMMIASGSRRRRRRGGWWIGPGGYGGWGGWGGGGFGGGGFGGGGGGFGGGGSFGGFGGGGSGGGGGGGRW